uniref:maleylacetoacetate isomerase n=1 Tax=Acrobeloides nanus TaxID=290746 RepID=A0A914E4Y0_9BILA
MSKPTLYSYWRSSCSWRVRIALALKGIDYDYKAINLLSGDQRSPEFLSQNPHGLVPLLIFDGTPISESIAIIEYLDEKFPNKFPKLLPDNAEDRAKVRSLAYAISSNIQPVQNLRVMKFYSKGDQAKNAEWAKHFIELGFDALEEELKKTAKKFSFGDTITLVDLCIPPQVYNARRFSVDMSKYPTIERIDKTLAEIPEFQAAQPNRQPDAPESERA